MVACGNEVAAVDAPPVVPPAQSVPSRNAEATVPAAGLIAVLFGAGNACQTTYTDARGDGVTNNGGTATTDLLGYCVACNIHTSVWPDDGGGYLRVVGVTRKKTSSRPAPHEAASGPPVIVPPNADVFERGTDSALWNSLQTAS